MVGPQGVGPVDAGPVDDGRAAERGELPERGTPCRKIVWISRVRCGTSFSRGRALSTLLTHSVASTVSTCTQETLTFTYTCAKLVVQSTANHARSTQRRDQAMLGSRARKYTAPSRLRDRSSDRGRLVHTHAATEEVVHEEHGCAANLERERLSQPRPAATFSNVCVFFM